MNLNILILWQAVSLPRGTDPNKGCIMNFFFFLVAKNARSLWEQKECLHQLPFSGELTDTIYV